MGKITEEVNVSKLKPCPCCGGEVYIDNIFINYVHIFSVICKNCSALFTLYDGIDFLDNEYELIKIWNRRTENENINIRT